MLSCSGPRIGCSVFNYFGNILISCFLPPERGLPSREAQILKNLVLLVCLSARILAEIYRTAYGPASNASTRHLFSECPKRVPQLLSLNATVSSISGPLFFRSLFRFLNKKYPHALVDPRAVLRFSCYSQILLASRLGSALPGGDMPRGSNLVNPLRTTAHGNL